jgi:hypothetical protein
MASLDACVVGVSSCQIKDKKLICEVDWCLSVMSGCADALQRFCTVILEL